MFPDMLYLHDFEETSLETFSVPVTEAPAADRETGVVDMEASGAFEAARAFMPLHRLAVLKVVLDHMDPMVFSAGDVERIMSARASRITDWLLRISGPPSPSCYSYSELQRPMTATCLDMSSTLKNEFENLLRYLQLADPDQKSRAAGMLNSRLCQQGRASRKEAKKIISDLRREARMLPVPVE
jgi:hypothetical protein